MSMLVITTHDKDKRDRMFEELRNSDDPYERQVVKFSGNELVHPEAIDMTVDPPKVEKAVYRSTWSIAHPIEGETA